MYIARQHFLPFVFGVLASSKMFCADANTESGLARPGYSYLHIVSYIEVRLIEI